MAGEELYGALSGLNYDPAETGWGTSQQVLASSLPGLMNPYQSAGTNIGIALGGALISGLLGYQARQSAAEQSLAANRLAVQLLEAPSATQRLNIIESTPDTLMQEKLLGVNTRLAAQQAAMQQLIAQEVAKRQGLAEFELGPTGTQLAEELNKREAQKQAMQYLELGNLAATPEGRAGLETMAEISRAKSAGVTERFLQAEQGKNLRQLFGSQQLSGAQFDTATSAARLGVSLQDLQKDIKDLSYLQIKTMIETGISPEDKPGLAQKFEQIQQLYRKPEFGATLTGNELKSSERVFGKNLAATKEDMLQALESLSKGQFAKAELTIQAKQEGPQALLESIRRAQTTGQLTFDETPSMPMSGQQNVNAMKAGQDFMTSLKSKYGSDWKTKITDNEKATLTALVNAAKGQ